MIDKTTIQTSRASKQIIDEHKLCKDETYENALNRLLDELDKRRMENNESNK